MIDHVMLCYVMLCYGVHRMLMLLVPLVFNTADLNKGPLSFFMKESKNIE